MWRTNKSEVTFKGAGLQACLDSLCSNHIRLYKTDTVTEMKYNAAALCDMYTRGTGRASFFATQTRQ